MNVDTSTERARIASVVLIGLFLTLCSPLKALACDTVQTATLESTCVVMAIQGRPGVWFDLTTADTLRRAKLEAPELRLQVEKFSLVEKKREAQVHALMEATALRREAADMLKASIDASVKDAREARQEAAEAHEELNAWYRSPWLWGVTGAVLGGALAGWLIAK